MAQHPKFRKVAVEIKITQCLDRAFIHFKITGPTKSAVRRRAGLIKKAFPDAVNTFGFEDYKLREFGETLRIET